MEEEDKEVGPNFVFSDAEEEEEQNDGIISNFKEEEEKESDFDQDVEDFLKELHQHKKESKLPVEKPKKVPKKTHKGKEDQKNAKRTISLYMHKEDSLIRSKDNPTKKKTTKHLSKQKIDKIFERLSNTPNPCKDEIAKRKEENIKREKEENRRREDKAKREKRVEENRKKTMQESIACASKLIHSFIEDAFGVDLDKNEKKEGEASETANEDKPEDEETCDLNELQESLMNLGIVNSISEKLNPPIEKESTKWEVENENGSDKMYSRVTAAKALIEAFDSKENTAFNRFIKSSINYALANNQIGKKDRKQGENEEKAAKNQSARDDQSSHISKEKFKDKYNKIIDNAFEGKEEEMEKEELFDSLMKLNIISSDKDEQNLPKCIKSKMNVWKLEEDETKYSKEKVVTDIKDASISTEKGNFISKVKTGLFIIIANRTTEKGKKIQEDKEKQKEKEKEEEKEKEKELEKENEKENKEGETENEKEEKKELTPEEEEELKKKEEERKKEEEKRKEEEKKKEEEMRKEVRKKIRKENQEAIQKAQARGLEKVRDKNEPKRTYEDFVKSKDKLFGDVKKPEGWDEFIKRKQEARNNEQEQRSHFTLYDVYETEEVNEEKKVEKEELTEEEKEKKLREEFEKKKEARKKLKKDKIEAIQKAQARGLEKVKDKNEPKRTYEDFVRIKDKLFGDVEKPNGWDEFFKRKQDEREKEQKRIENEKKVLEQRMATGRSTSSLSTESSFRQSNQNPSTAASFVFDDSSADDLI